LLSAALATNRFVPKFLLREEQLPEDAPPYYSFGDRPEAIIYVQLALGAWRSTPGATTWLKQVLNKPKRSKAKVDESFRPSADVRARIARLPTRAVEWQAGYRQIPTWVVSDGDRFLPWSVVVANRTDDVILASHICTGKPTAGVLWNLLFKALSKPAAGEPHRPEQIRLVSDPTWDALEPHLAALGIQQESAQELDFLTELFADLREHMTKRSPPGLLDFLGVSPERVVGFYRAAAYYFRQAPWRRVGDQHAIKIESARSESGPWYAVVMGQSGIALGLALYENLSQLRDLWEGEESDMDHTREMVVLSVTFDAETDSNPKDVLAARQHGWEVAHAEAFPTPFRKERGLTMRPPLSWELELLTGCLHVVPEFIARHKPGDTSQHSLKAPTASGDLDFTLSWIPES
jgi:hypothetical protein